MSLASAMSLARQKVDRGKERERAEPLVFVIALYNAFSFAGGRSVFDAFAS